MGAIFKVSTPMTSMGPPVVSVVITTYNYGRFIEEAIESVLSQDFPPDQMEVLVVDDGSTDDTAERVRKYGSNVRYFHQPNGGQASALNLGFAKARGEIVALLDADDYWLPGKIQRIVLEFQKNSELGMVYHPFLEFDTETNERRKPYFRPISGHFFGNKPEFFWYQLPGTSTAYRRKFLEPVLPIPEEIRMLADGYISALLPLYSPVLAIPEYLAAYRFHGNNCFYVDQQQMPSEIRKGRLHKWQILIVAIRKALADKGFNPEQPPMRSFLDRLALRQETDEFVLQAPGRLRFIRHLLFYNRCYGPYMSQRLRFINYFNALGALATGYKHFHLLDQWRVRATGVIRGLFRTWPHIEKQTPGPKG
jgi:glycosyltransferase involved in cell wall biosynthesis